MKIGTRRGTTTPAWHLSENLGMAVRSQRMFVCGRLLPCSGLPQMDADFGVHDVEGRADRRGFHAHEVGTSGAAIRHYAAARGGAGVRRHHGVRIGLCLRVAEYILLAVLGLIEPVRFATARRMSDAKTAVSG